MTSRLSLVKPIDPRVDMPEVADWIDRLRAKAGVDLINAAMKRGLRDGGFWAIEGQYVIGAPPLRVVERVVRRLERDESLRAEFSSDSAGEVDDPGANGAADESLYDAYDEASHGPLPEV